MRRISIVLLLLLAVVLIPGQAQAKTSATETITPNPASVGQTFVVSVTGLPVGSAVNLFVTAPDGTVSGSPLGSTPDGTFALDESAPSAGDWTYTFTGPTKRHNTVVYASATVTVV